MRQLGHTSPMNHDDQRIRVLRIIARMNVGGPAIQVSGLMRNLNVEVFEQRLFTGFCEANESDYLEKVATDIKVTRIDGFGRRVNLLGDIKSLMELIKEIRKFKPHIIHTHTTKAGFIGRVASILSLYPSIRIHTFHGHLLSGYFGKYKTYLIILSERFLALFTDQLLAVGDKVMQDLLQAKIGEKDKFSIMPPGLQLNSLPPTWESRDILGLTRKQMYCSYIGRVTQIKRPDRFLDVVREIGKRNVDLHFLIVGDGELLDYCRKRIEQEKLPVKVLGWRNDIERVLAASNIVILTSDNEGTPLSLIQAGMANIPVVATNVGSISEVVLNGITGIITSAEVNELADALEMLSNDSHLRQSLGVNAQKFTKSNFGVQRLVSDHEELYQKLISNRANS
jgi:glycosyltransferase involved in cell wall biosynthesis